MNISSKKMHLWPKRKWEVKIIGKPSATRDPLLQDGIGVTWSAMAIARKMQVHSQRESPAHSMVVIIQTNKQKKQPQVPELEPLSPSGGMSNWAAAVENSTVVPQSLNTEARDSIHLYSQQHCS